MAKKHLGQNFLFDPSILHRIIGVSGIGSGDTVVEIGPGHGTMTMLLSGAAQKVIAIELDEDLYEKLQDKTRDRGNIELVHADALTFPYEELGPFKVVSNIPYYITTPIIFRLIEAKDKLRSMTLTIQKEVAQRIVATPDSKEYGILSLAVQYRADPRLEFIIPRGAFRPVPKVDSAVLRMDIRREPLVRVKNEKLFFSLIRTAFSQRRKTLANSLKPTAPDIKAKLELTGIDPIRRAETLSIGEFAKLADALQD